jgi:hypothetical protein
MLNGTNVQSSNSNATPINPTNANNLGASKGTWNKN